MILALPKINNPYIPFDLNNLIGGIYMKKLSLKWKLFNNEINKEVRYCHNCGKQRVFTDSLKRRQNANGKNLYNFAIYKCPNNHTWNKSINSIDEDYIVRHSQYEEIDIMHLIQEGYSHIEIVLEEFEYKMRIDKFLSSKIMGMSRNKIVKEIDKGSIKINGENIVSKTQLKTMDIISIEINK